MDTILNLGLNDDTTKALAELTGNEKFAYDAYRRFIKMFGDVVLKISYGKFSKHERALFKQKPESEMTAQDCKDLVAKFKEVLENEKATLPYEPREQLKLAINAVFDSFNNPRAKYHRKKQGILTNNSSNVQAMVLETGRQLSNGCLFTRDPKTGLKTFWRVVT